MIKFKKKTVRSVYVIGQLKKCWQILTWTNISVAGCNRLEWPMSSRFVSVSLFCLQVLLAMRANVEDRGMKGDCTPLMEVMILIRFTFLFQILLETWTFSLFTSKFNFSWILEPPTISVPDCLVLVCCCLVVFTAHATSNMPTTPLQSSICLYCPRKIPRPVQTKTKLIWIGAHADFFPGGLCRTHGYRPPTDCPWRWCQRAVQVCFTFLQAERGS